MLFCFDEKCTGRIDNVKELQTISHFEIRVKFIEPDYFKKEAVVGNRVTIREASIVLTEGHVTETF